MTSKPGMWKLLVPSFLLLAFGTSQFAAAVPTTLCVNPAGSNGCYRTITAALAAAPAGATVNVAPGTYAEAVIIRKPVFLLGAGSTKTVVNARGLPNAIYVDGLDNPGLSGVTVTGFKLENANFEGFAATSVSNLNFSGNLVTGNDKSQDTGSSTCPGLTTYAPWETAEGLDCGEGIHIAGTSYSTIANNVSEGNAGGILITDNTARSQYNVISGNTIKDNLYDCGITMPSQPPYPSGGSPHGVYNNVIYNNTVTGNGTGLAGAGAGVLLAGGGPGSAIVNTLIVGNTLTHNGIPGVVFHAHSTGVTIQNTIVAGNTITNNGSDVGDAATPGTTGINFFGSAALGGAATMTGTQIYGNNITGQDYSIIANSSTNPLTVHLNNLTNVGGGGLASLSNDTIDATQNYWGCTEGPTTTSCATATGPGITTSPYLTSPATY
jgi:parallel beta-helix repeat protein